MCSDILGSDRQVYSKKRPSVDRFVIQNIMPFLATRDDSLLDVLEVNSDSLLDVLQVDSDSLLDDSLLMLIRDCALHVKE